MKSRPRKGFFCCISSNDEEQASAIDKHLEVAEGFLRARGYNEAEIKAELLYLKGREATLLYRHYSDGLRGKTIRALKRLMPDFRERLHALLYPDDFPYHYMHEILSIILKDKAISIDGLVAFFNLSHFTLAEIETTLEKFRKEGNSYLEAIYALSASEIKSLKPN